MGCLFFGVHRWRLRTLKLHVYPSQIALYRTTSMPQLGFQPSPLCLPYFLLSDKEWIPTQARHRKTMRALIMVQQEQVAGVSSHNTLLCRKWKDIGAAVDRQHGRILLIQNLWVLKFQWQFTWFLIDKSQYKILYSRDCINHLRYIDRVV